MRFFNKKSLIAISSILLLIVVLLIVNAKISALTDAYANAKVRQLVSVKLNKAIEKELTGIKYDDLVTITTDSTGKITALRANTLKMNLISAALSEDIQNRMIEINSQSDLGISLGSLLGSDLFAGKGPKIPIRVTPIGFINPQFSSRLEQSGINQTRHVIDLMISIQLDIISPVDTIQIKVERDIPVCDTVLMGAIPNTYLKIDSSDQMLNLLPVG